MGWPTRCRPLCQNGYNGIEYGDMQLICEAYYYLKKLLASPTMNSTMSSINGIACDLQSYLIEITRDIFSVKDDQGGSDFLVDKILDVAGAKVPVSG